jgi:hypothetical protein
MNFKRLSREAKWIALFATQHIKWRFLQVELLAGHRTHLG